MIGSCAAGNGIGYWCRRPELSATLLREMWFVEGPWVEKRREETDGVIGFVRQLLEGARERGVLRSGVDLRHTAEAMYSFYVVEMPSGGQYRSSTTGFARQPQCGEPERTSDATGMSPLTPPPNRPP